MSRKSFAAILFFLAVCRPWAVFAGEEADSASDLAAIREHYERTYTHLDSLYLEQLVLRPAAKTGVLTPTIQVLEACRPGEFFQRTVHFGSDPLVASPGPLEDDPLLNWLLVRNGVSLQAYPSSGVAVIDGRALEASPTGELIVYTSAIGFPFPEQHKRLEASHRPSGEVDETALITATDYFLPYAFRGPGWHVDKKEAVDGSECLVVTRTIKPRTTDMLWVDRQNQDAIRRRRITNGTAFIDIHSFNFRNYGNGVAWPDLVKFESNQQPKRQEFRLLNVRFADIPNELFEVRLAPGSLVQDNLHRRLYVVPGGEEILEKTINRAEAYLHSGRLVAATSTRWQEYVSEWILPLLPAAVLAIAIFVKLAKDRRGRFNRAA